MNQDEYRWEHINFHNGRVITFMTAAGAIKRYAILEAMRTGEGELSESVCALIQKLVQEARAENQIARWWRHLSDEQIQRQREFWNN